ncbi:MAG: RNA polymerase subunit sigma-24 [Acidobacteria bacterium]|nr:MAG: RNA polymerase subunit sigma-24 [Acidobacteriota bacterium]PYX47092.1 MAG: RNA polymerase subunit sigma-24 [Acidobacteriota bacterium]
MAELSYIGEMSDEDRRISEAVVREQGRLRNFVRKYVSDQSDVEDILQDVFYEFVAAFRMLRPVEHATAWLFRVARNRIIDRFRGKTRDVLRNAAGALPEEGALDLEELLPSPDAGPEAAYVRSVLLEEIDDALLELPEEQREVFIGHELLGYSFQEMAEETGVSVNTLLSRKRYAVLHLRRRLRAIHEEFKKS